MSDISKNLSGVWKVQVLRNTLGQESLGFLQVIQGPCDLSMSLFTQSSSSYSLTAQSFYDKKGYGIGVVYRNVNLSQEEHFGSAVYRYTDSNDSDLLEAEYWTSNQNLGKIVVLEKKEGVIHSFDEAVSLFE